ncbi:hypothetical protein Tco_0465929 [Tanacetum coccineum]
MGSLSDDKNGEIASNGGIWSDDGFSDGSDFKSDVEFLLHLIDQVEHFNAGNPESDDYILFFNILLENATNKKELEEFHRFKARKEAEGTKIFSHPEEAQGLYSTILNARVLDL